MTIDPDAPKCISLEIAREATLPKDLFIPPDALMILLHTFEGPLDLLYYLIKKQNINILDIPVALIAQQYIEYIDMMAAHRLTLAAEYLVMAAMLAEIKSRMLLPVHPAATEEEIDPRMELVHKLQAYEQMKQAGILLDAMECLERDRFMVTIKSPDALPVQVLPTVSLLELIEAYKKLMRTTAALQPHQVARENLSTRDRMDAIVRYLEQEPCVALGALFARHEGRMGLVTTFLALLELARLAIVHIIQSEPGRELFVTRGTESYGIT